MLLFEFRLAKKSVKNMLRFLHHTTYILCPGCPQAASFWNDEYNDILVVARSIFLANCGKSRRLVAKFRSMLQPNPRILSNIIYT